MNLDCASFIDWLIPIVFWFGVVVGVYVGTVITLIFVWRRSGNKESEQAELLP